MEVQRGFRNSTATVCYLRTCKHSHTPKCGNAGSGSSPTRRAPRVRSRAEYFDEGVSGAKSSRPALDEMLADAKRGKFRILLGWKLDRLGRSLAHLVRLLEDLRACNVELVSFSEGLDFTTTTGKLLYQMLSAFAEFERDCIRERVRSGLRNARAKGKRLGRPRVFTDASRIAALRKQGRSWSEIVSETGVSKGTAQRAVFGLPKNI